ncbi:MAG: GEVED domain-containing protein, partial [Flavobacteriales bacterium]
MNPNTNPKRKHWWTRLASLLVLFALIGTAGAQTVSTTSGLANNNGSSVAVFSVLNTTGAGVLLSEIGSIAGVTNTYTAHLYARSVAYDTPTDVPPAISLANGWNVVASNSSLPLTGNTTTSVAQTFITGMSYFIPPLTQVQFALQTVTGAGQPTYSATAGSLRYSTVGVQQSVYNVGGMEIRVGTGYGYGGAMPSPTFTPRGFIGYMTFSAASPCSGTPSPGNTLSNASTACSGSNFTLSLQNATSGTGVSYQWYASTDGGMNYNPVGPNAATYVTSLAATTMYYCDVTCAGNGTGSSAPVTVTLNTDPCICITYAASNATITADTKIDSVKVNGVGFGSPAATCETYTFTTSTGFSLQQGASAVVRLRNGSCSGTHYAAYYSLYADFNGNGSFADPGETLSQGGPTTALNTIPNLNITIPPTANTGPVRFRAVLTEAGAPPPATGTYSYGETEDFCVNITAAFACSGTPDPGNTLSSVPVACSAANFNLSLQNATLGSGVTYQWEYADDEFFTVNQTIFGGSTSTQTANQTSPQWYRCLVTCTEPGGGAAYSDPIFVDLAGAAYCAAYCTAGLYTTGTGAGDLISNVAITGTTLSNNTGFLAGTPAYTFYPPNPPSNTQTATLQAGSSYSLNVSTGEWGNQGFAVWIDYNDDGIFSTPSERVGATPGQVGSGFTPGVVNASASFPITLACNPSLGDHRMRVRCVYNLNGVLVEPCASYTWGEVEDYIVTITAPDPCPAPSNLLAVTSGNSATLTWSTGCAETLWNVHVQPAGGGTPGTPSDPGVGPTPELVVSGLVNGTTYEFYVQADCIGDGTSSWAGPFEFAPPPLNNECTGVTPQSVGALGSVTFNGNSTGATDTEGFGGLVVWEAFTLTDCVQSLEVSYCGSTPARTVAYINLFTSCPWDAQPFVAATSILNDCPNGGRRHIYGNLNPGTYYIAISEGIAGGSGPYSVEVLPGAACPPPACAINPSPADGGATCPTQSVTLSWPAVAFATGYDVILDGNTVATNQPGTTYIAGILAAGPHTWSVIPQSPQGPATGCPTWNFTGDLFGCYCTSIPGSAIDEEIFSVTVNGVTVGDITPYPGPNTGCTVPAPGAGSILNRYSNWRVGLTPQFSVQQGVPSSYTVQEDECDGPTYFAFGTGMWIDWNQDGDFDDAGETILQEGATLAGPRNIIGNFTPPVTPNLGLTMMRVIVAEGVSGAGLVPCLVYNYGETEDFLINVLPPPTPASATASIIDDCDYSTYTIDVNIADFGNGTPGDIVYSVNGGTPVTVTASLGSNIIPTSGSFSQPGDAVEISVTNNTVSILDLGTFYGNCPITVTCGQTVSVDHCYGNGDTRTFTFIASNPGETVTLSFISGTMDPNDVIRGYSGTDNTGLPIVELTGSFANLGSPTVTGTSLGNELFLEIDSDGSNSCQDNQQTTWEFEVECTPGCVDPDGTASYDLCTQLITVNLDFDGDGASAGVRYILNGGTPVDVTGLNAPATEVLGPFTPGDAVQVFLLHENDGSCNKNLGTINIVAPVGQPNLVTSASPAAICVGGSSTLNAVASGGSGPVGSYIFQTNTSGGLLPMTSPVQIQGPNLDDTGGPLTGIGFTFSYGTATYTQFSTNSNGLMRLGPTACSGSRFNDPLTGATDTPLLAAWWDDLHTGTDGNIRTSLEGTPGNYVRIVEWFVRIFGTGTAANMRFQVVLYEADGTVEFRYGTTGQAYIDGASVAITGGTTAARVAVNSATHTASNVTLYDQLQAWPGGDRLYRFLKPEVSGTTYDWSPATYLSGTTGNTVTASGVAETTIYTVTATAPGGCPQTAQVTVTVNDPISAGTISPVPASFCTGGSVTLTATPTDGVAPYTYAWTGPGGPAGTTQNQVVNTPGLWSCLITDACSGTVTVSTNVTSTTPPAVSINATAPICEGGSVTLSANVISGSVSGYLWGGAAPVGGQTGSSVTINGLTAANNGNYTLTAFDGGCASVAANYNLSVNANPSITSTTATPNPVCEGSNSTLQVNLAAPSAYCATSYSTGTGFGDFLTSVSIPGTTLNNSTGASAAPYYTLYPATGSTTATLSAGTSYTLNAIAGTYTINDVAVWIDYNQDGVFQDPAEKLGQVDNFGAAPTVASITFTVPLTALNGSTRMRVREADQGITNGMSACGALSFGEVEDYVVTITGGASLGYAWSGGTFLGGINNTQSVTATSITSATPYSVQVTSSAGCTSTGNVTVNVTPLPAAPDCGGPYATLCVAGPSFQLTPGTPGGVWSGTGVTSGGLFNPAVGTQLLTYTVTESGCSNSCTVTVNVNSADTDGDGIPDCVDECPLLFGEIG